MNAGGHIRVTATGQIHTGPGRLLGFYVSETSSGTVVLRDGNSGGTQITGTVTPAVGWHELPANFAHGLHATIGGSSLDVTFLVAG
jgi:hypothetical protein